MFFFAAASAPVVFWFSLFSVFEASAGGGGREGIPVLVLFFLFACDFYSFRLDICVVILFRGLLLETEKKREYGKECETEEEEREKNIKKSKLIH